MLLSYQRAGLYLMAAAAIGLAVLVFIQTADATETAQAATSALKLQIDTDCKAGDATFKVQNTGDAWPKSSTFSIYRILGEGKGHVISKRRMRLNSGQRASFRIKASKNTTGRLGISIDPSWHHRDRRLDAKLECR